MLRDRDGKFQAGGARPPRGMGDGAGKGERGTNWTSMGMPSFSERWWSAARMKPAEYKLISTFSGIENLHGSAREGS